MERTGSKTEALRKHRAEGHAHSPVEEATRYMCDACATAGFGPRLSCSSCGLTFHTLCAGGGPSSLPCFLHPGRHGMPLLISKAANCVVCHGKIDGSHYRCIQTGWNGHLMCLLLRLAPAVTGAAPKVVTMAHRGHSASDHPLKEIYIEAAYRCNACGTMGFGRRYRCEACDFDLHHCCAECSEKQRCLCVVHPEHEMARAAFASETRCPCYVCGDPIARTDRIAGRHYLCEKSGRKAHPVCCRLQQLCRVPEAAATAIYEGIGSSDDSSRRRSTGTRRIRKRKIVFMIARSIILHSIGVPDVFSLSDLFDLITSF